MSDILYRGRTCEAPLRHSEADLRLSAFIAEYAPILFTPQTFAQACRIASVHAAYRRYIDEQKHTTQTTY